MSLVTNTSQPSARIAVRLVKLQTLHQMLTQGKSDQEISKAYASLKKIDQEGIYKKIHGKEIGSSEFERKKALTGVVKGRIRTLTQSKAGRAFQTNVAKGRIATNPFSTVPAPVQTTVTGSFCAPKDLANFRASFKDAAKIESASHIIKTYQLDHLIETYLHCSCSDLNESDKVKALHELMSLAYSLSKIEKLPKPGYSSLSTFFQEVEARNLIRMMAKIDEAQKLPDLPESARDLQVPKDSTETMQKAERLRGWIHQHQDFLAAINGTLDLSACCLSLVPKEIGQLQALEILYLENNRLVSVPKEIGQLKALQGLRLSNNSLVSVPKEIGQLKALEGLYLDNNRLISMPKEIGQLQALQELYLNNSRLVSVPKEIGQLQGLQRLYLYNNRLVSVPKEIFQLQALETLDLHSNHLIKVPKEISQLKALKILDLYSNRLIKVPKEIGQLQALEWLDLHSNRLVSVPKEIGQLKALQGLDLHSNRLVSVPKEIGQLQALLQLNLDNNCLVSMPKEIGQLKALRELHLGNNYLVSVPKEIGQLKALRILRLDNNRLVSVPKEISQLQEISLLQEEGSLYLGGNGLISLPVELDRFKGELEKQNKRLQLKNILGRLSLYVTGQHNTTKIGDLLNTMQKLLGNEKRSQIHRCLYEAAKKAAKTDKALREKLKDEHFARKAFLDENINPKLKAAAIAKFRKKLEKQASTKK